MEYREPCPPTTDIQHLEQVGFSHEQIAGLLRVKALSERGAYHKAESSDKRQAFIRWLSLQGRLQSYELIRKLGEKENDHTVENR